MSILNTKYIKDFITNNLDTKTDDTGRHYEELFPIKYRWTHGAGDLHLGDGLLIYSIIHYLRAKTCVCLGSGGGFIPRIMTQARFDLYEAGIFEGNNDINWGDIGSTYLVDASNGVGGFTDWTDENSFFRKNFDPRLLLTTTERAFYDFFVKEDIKIDYLHIDAGHSYEDVKQDFELYSKLLSPNGIISIHDTDKTYSDDYIVTKDISDQDHHAEFANGPSKFIEEIGPEFQRFDLFNNGILKDKPSSTGLTLFRYA